MSTCKRGTGGVLAVWSRKERLECLPRLQRQERPATRSMLCASFEPPVWGLKGGEGADGG